jgi:glutamyl-tRNA synthetase
MKPRLRFAPSPTGQLHLGGARTALSNYLYAKKNGGQFLVRIEDTDLERSKKEHTDQICDSLQWLGLNWDEELVYQSKRGESYNNSLEDLLSSGKAYRCFASKEELEQIRKEAGSYHYSGLWRNKSDNDINIELEKKTPFTIRLRSPNDGHTVFNDMIYGNISISNSEIDDFIIARSDGSPVYNFTNVIDDQNMNITHVVRGEDHISNTPKQILIYKAFSWEPPIFAHLPMILGEDKKRLSKRHGATGVQSYRDEGFQPESLLNYLALLGWNPGTEEEIMDLDQLVSKFDISKVQKKAAVFDQKKLNWISSQHLALQNDQDILDRIRLISTEWGIKEDNSFCLCVINIMKTRSRSLVDLIEQAGYFFNDPSSFNENDVQKTWKEDSQVILEEVIQMLGNIDDWTANELELILKKYMENNGYGFGKVMKPVRLGLCGNLQGPSLFDIMELLGKEVVINRLNYLIKEI